MEDSVQGELKSHIFYSISDIIALTNTKILECQIIKEYSFEFHNEVLDFFITSINTTVEYLCKKNKNTPGAVVTDLIFCVVCLIDDLFLKEKQDIRRFWTKENLEMRMLQSQSGGDKFYANINFYLKESNRNNNDDILLIYYLCLKCGFTGNLRSDLVQLKNVEYKIHTKIQLNQPDLFPIIRKNIETYPISFFRRSILFINNHFLLINCVILFLFLIVSSIIWEYQTAYLLDYVNNLATKIS